MRRDVPRDRHSQKKERFFSFPYESLKEQKKKKRKNGLRVLKEWGT